MGVVEITNISEGPKGGEVMEKVEIPRDLIERIERLGRNLKTFVKEAIEEKLSVK